MRTKNILAALIGALILSLPPSGGAAAETGGVIVTIKPLHSLVAGVMGKTGTPELLVTDKASPHGFQLKPSQMKALQSANVVFYVDDSFEIFLRDALAILPSHIRKVPVARKAGLEILASRRGGAWAAHEHEEHSRHENHGHDHIPGDMHVWLDPANAGKIVKFIAEELSAAYPENGNVYKANANALAGRLNALDAKLEEDLAGLKDKPFIVFHDAYQYFEKRYGLSGVGSITFEPDEAPSPHRIKEMRKKLSQTNAKCVFREAYLSGRLVNAVIEGSAAKSGTLDPEAAALEPGKDLYFIMMENLADSLKRCLG